MEPVANTSHPSGESLPDAAPPPILPGEPPPIGTVGPPPRPAEFTPSPASGRALATLLSAYVGLFLADGIVSLVDDSLILWLRVDALTGIRGWASLLTLLMTVVVYCLIGFMPSIPKRLFLPLTLFNPAAFFLAIPFFIYFHGRAQLVAWTLSLCQVIFGLAVLWWAQGGLSFHWPLVPECRMAARPFRWSGLAAFLLANALLLVPGTVVYLAVCAALAVDHFSAGFLALRPGGISVRARTYIRADGKMVQLVPMAHVGEAAFYRELARSFPTNALVLMEGVSDSQNLLTNRLRYRRMATSLGLSEQQREFKPSPSRQVQADVDVEQFAASTIDFLNLVTLVHAKGFNPETLSQLLRYSPPRHFEEQLLDDLLRGRNRRVLDEITARLPEAEFLVVPWGAAHMPGIEAGIRETGFRMAQSREYEVIRFRFLGRSRAQNRPGP